MNVETQVKNNTDNIKELFQKHNALYSKVQSHLELSGFIKEQQKSDKEELNKTLESIKTGIDELKLDVHGIKSSSNQNKNIWSTVSSVITILIACCAVFVSIYFNLK